MEELNCNFFNNPTWDNNNNNNNNNSVLDQKDPFESALSSMVSSPTASNTFNNGGAGENNNNNIVLRELIGRLGSICNSGEISPFPNNNNNAASCYSTPLNSPPKLNLENHQQQMRPQQNPSSYPSFPFTADPGFAERAARFSCFAQMGLGEIGAKLDSTNISRVSSNQSIKDKMDVMESREISSISEQIQVDANSRKRKSAPKGKGKENPASAPANDANVVAGSESNESSAKRSKSDDGKDKDNGDAKSKDSSKTAAAEAPKDYIHVRARRGQATDAHSLAERVRREKISERMKLLQDLVPGCNKVTGKAVMLDEIINYVQSLQRQVEFLSMKLSTVNPRMDFNVETLVSKDMFQSRGPLPPNMYPSDCYPFQSQPNLHSAIPNGTEALNHFSASLGRNQLPPMNGFSETASQVSAYWENDLNNVVQMGFGQNLTQDINGAQMKVEP